MRASVHRRLSVVVLALWMAPSVGSLALGLHVALSHAVPDHPEHASEASGLAGAAAHEHQHDAAAVPDHEHETTADGSSLALRPSPFVVAELPSLDLAGAVLTEQRALEGCPRRAPPDPLFTAHCSLLL